MLGKRRTSYDILHEIVEDCKEPIGKTDLYHKLKTQFGLLEHWTGVALELELIQLHGNMYQTTIKGHEFLQKWAELQTILSRE